jgi:catechol 2,3-dioxygenase-like lactoylglutathione lyase family enzyme
MTLGQSVPLFNVRDMDRSLAFYVDGLGFAVTNEWRPEGELRWCQVERDSA